MSNEEKCENINALMQWSFDDLYELKQKYWEASKEFPSEKIYEKFQIIDEAIACKVGKEEEAFDFLS